MKSTFIISKDLLRSYILRIKKSIINNNLRISHRSEINFLNQKLSPYVLLFKFIELFRLYI